MGSRDAQMYVKDHIYLPLDLDIPQNACSAYVWACWLVIATGPLTFSADFYYVNWIIYVALTGILYSGYSRRITRRTLNNVLGIYVASCHDASGKGGLCGVAY